MELNEIIKSGNNVMLVVSSNDLLRFADTIVQKALENHANEETQQRKEDEAEEKFDTVSKSVSQLSFKKDQPCLASPEKFVILVVQI